MGLTAEIDGKKEFNRWKNMNEKLKGGQEEKVLKKTISC